MVELPTAPVVRIVRKTGVGLINEAAGMEMVLEKYGSKISMDTINQQFSLAIRRHNR
jgi:histone H3/H4